MKNLSFSQIKLIKYNAFMKTIEQIMLVPMCEGNVFAKLQC